MDTFVAMIQPLIVTYGFNILGAIVIVLIGRWLAAFASRMSRKLFDKYDLDKSLTLFLTNLIHMLILLFTALAAFDRLGIQTTSFIALLGAAGLAIGLALEGSLANFAAGVLLLLFRPFKVGDLVEAAGNKGTVEAIQIFNTILTTPQRKTIIIPNAQINSGSIVNYSLKGIVRIDMTFGIGYGDDLRKAKTVLLELMTADERILQDPPPSVVVVELGDSSVNLSARPYIDISGRPGDYFAVPPALTEAVKLRFDAEGISIPFPQRDVHLYQEK